MKVLIVAPSCGKDISLLGGAPEMIHRVATELNQRDISVRMTGGANPLFILKIWQYVRHADVIYLSPIYAMCVPITLSIAKIQSKPVILAPHGSLQRWKGTTKPRIKCTWEAICRLLAPRNFKIHTTCEQEMIESSAVFPNARFFIIPNGVDIPSTVRKVQSAAPPTRLLFIGRIHPKKGIENLLRACAMLKTEQFSLTIAGSGKTRYEKYIQKLINQLQLDRKVHMVGHVQGDKREQAWNETHITVVPSHTENFANVVAESLARGVPVIASKNTPWKGLEDHHCGRWVSNEPEQLARAIRGIIKDNLQEMGTNGKSWMMQQFSWDKQIQLLIPELEFSK